MELRYGWSGIIVLFYNLKKYNESDCVFCYPKKQKNYNNNNTEKKLLKFFYGAQYLNESWHAYVNRFLDGVRT